MKVVVYDVAFEQKCFIFTSYKQFRKFLGFITYEQYDLFYNLVNSGRYIIVKEK